MCWQHSNIYIWTQKLIGFKSYNLSSGDFFFFSINLVGKHRVEFTCAFSIGNYSPMEMGFFTRSIRNDKERNVQVANISNVSHSRSDAGEDWSKTIIAIISYCLLLPADGIAFLVHFFSYSKNCAQRILFIKSVMVCSTRRTEKKAIKNSFYRQTF